MKFLFLLCSDPAIDPVAPALYAQARDLYQATPTPFFVDGKKVLEAQVGDHLLYFAETSRLASDLYPQIASELNGPFSDVDMIGLVNWHAGANAPAKIFCAHSTADVSSGIFGPTSGELLAAALMAIEAERTSAGLGDFRTFFEASHWSGTMSGRPASELLEVKPPVFDIEIGSFPDDWANIEAQRVLVKAFGKIGDFCGMGKTRALFLGGMHFEPSATELLFQNIVIEHHLPNQWLVKGEYNLPGAEDKIIAAAKSCSKPPELIVYHAGLKSAYKECARKAAALLGVPCVSHKQMRAPDWKQVMNGI